jgi:hypothetical protein
MPFAYTHVFVTLVQDRKGFNPAGLDSNHSHFILVEDESYRKGAGFGCDQSIMRITRVMMRSRELALQYHLSLMRVLVLAVSVACKRHRCCVALMMLDHARLITCVSCCYLITPTSTSNTIAGVNKGCALLWKSACLITGLCVCICICVYTSTHHLIKPPSTSRPLCSHKHTLCSGTH